MVDTRRDLERLHAAAEHAGVTVRTFGAPASRHVVLRGVRFHYLDWRSGGPPLAFLHGGSLNSHSYDLICLALHDDYRCVCLDQRGHGDSEWPTDGDYRLETQAEDIVAWQAHLRLNRFVLVGMSLGGMNAIAFAAANPSALAGLVLVDVGPDLRAEGRERIGRFLNQTRVLDSVEAFVERSLQFNPRRDARLLRQSLLNNLRQLPDGRWTWKWD